MEGGPLPLGPISSTRSPDFWTFLPQVDEKEWPTAHKPTASPLHRTAQTSLAAAAHAAGAAKGDPFRATALYVFYFISQLRIPARRLAGCTYLHTHSAYVGQALERSFFSRRLGSLPTLPSNRLQSSRLQATNCQNDFFYLTEMSQDWQQMGNRQLVALLLIGQSVHLPHNPCSTPLLKKEKIRKEKYVNGAWLLRTGCSTAALQDCRTSLQDLPPEF